MDYSAAGTPIGLGFTTPGQISAGSVNAVLENLGFAALTPEELGPLRAA